MKNPNKISKSRPKLEQTNLPVIGKNAEKLEQTNLPVIGKNARKQEFKEQSSGGSNLPGGGGTVLPGQGNNVPSFTSVTNPDSWNLFNDFDTDFSCIINTGEENQIKFMKSAPNNTSKYVYEYTTEIVDGEATKVVYYINGDVEFKKRDSDEIVEKGKWKCTGRNSFQICWEDNCAPVDVGLRGVSLRTGSDICCSGTSGTSGASGTSGTSGTSGKSGGGSAPFSCPSGYVTTSLSIDVVWDCDNKKSFKPCMKGRVIKELQEIPALAFYIELIQKRDNKSVKFDEYYGPIMKEAVEMLQSEPSRSLTTDGIIGCATLNSLVDNPDAPDTSDVDDDSNIQDNLDNSNTDIKKNEDNKTDVKKIKPSFQVDRSFFNPNDEW